MMSFNSTEPPLLNTNELRSLVTDETPRTDGKENRSFFSALKAIATDSPILSSMVVFVPIGFVAHFMEASKVQIFMSTFLGIVPMAWLIGKSTEDLSSNTNQVFGGLINATFGNIVEMLLCIFGILHNQLIVVKCTLIGSMLSNLLLVLGTSFWYGGIYYKRQKFNAVGARVQASLMLVGVLALILPTMYASLATNDLTDGAVLEMSRIGSIILLIIYVSYLYFQLGTHQHLFVGEEEEEEDETSLSFYQALFVLGTCTVLTSFLSDFLIASIEPTVISLGTSKEFIGIIVLPIIGNAAEHYTAITMAGRNKMDLSLGVAVGSGCQMMLLVTPFCVVMGWFLQRPMSLNFHPFQAGVLMISVMICNSILGNGETNWLEGVTLVMAYIFIAVIYWFDDPTNQRED